MPVPEVTPAQQPKLTDIETKREDAEERGWTSEVDRHEHVIHLVQGHLGRINCRRSRESFPLDLLGGAR